LSGGSNRSGALKVDGAGEAFLGVPTSIGSLATAVAFDDSALVVGPSFIVLVFLSCRAGCACSTGVSFGVAALSDVAFFVRSSCGEGFKTGLASFSKLIDARFGFP